MMAALEQINQALSRYYQTLHQPYDNQFIKYCNENGIDDDSLDKDILEQLIDFDDDFPFHQSPSDSDKFIHAILEACYLKPHAIFITDPFPTC